VDDILFQIKKFGIGTKLTWIDPMHSNISYSFYTSWDRIQILMDRS